MADTSKDASPEQTEEANEISNFRDVEPERAPPKHLLHPIIKASYLSRPETMDRYMSMLPSLGPIFFSLFSLFFSAAWAKSSTGNSVLVVLQPDLKRDNFSTFFNNLESSQNFFPHWGS